MTKKRNKNARKKFFTESTSDYIITRIKVGDSPKGITSLVRTKDGDRCLVLLIFFRDEFMNSESDNDLIWLALNFLRVLFKLELDTKKEVI